MSSTSGAFFSIDRAIWVAGVGQDNLVRIPVAGANRAMDVEALDAAIRTDLDAGHLPAGIIASVGGTSVGGTDDVAAVVRFAAENGLKVAPQATGHGAVALPPLGDAILLRTERLAGLAIDAAARTARVEPGAKWGPVADAAWREAWGRIPAARQEDVSRVYANIGKAIAAYERRVAFAPARFDRYVDAELAGRPHTPASALDDDERQDHRARR